MVTGPEGDYLPTGVLIEEHAAGHEVLHLQPKREFRRGNACSVEIGCSGGFLHEFR